MSASRDNHVDRVGACPAGTVTGTKGVDDKGVPPASLNVKKELRTTSSAETLKGTMI